MKKKLIALALVTIIAVMAIAGSSLAWLQDTTETVTNTFTEGKVDITLEETTGEEYKMVPGNDIDKDPTVSVVADSEACWLFVEVKEVNNVDTFLTYAFAEGWQIYVGTFDNDATNGDETVIIYRAVSADDAKAGVTYSVLAGDKVTVKPGVVMDDMTKLTPTTRPQLKFTAYAVQSANVATEDDAWDIINPAGN